MRPPGVYRPQCDTWLLAQAMRTTGVARGARVLDVCAGTGALAIAAAGLDARSVTAVDISRRAVLAIRLNALLAGQSVRVLHGDLFTPVAEERFDLVLANPPYVPDGDGLPHVAWDAGADGRTVLDRICAAAPAALARGGTLLLAQSELSDVAKSCRDLRNAGLRARVIARRQEPFGPVLRRREDELRERDLLEPGQYDEELVIIRADR